MFSYSDPLRSLFFQHVPDWRLQYGNICIEIRKSATDFVFPYTLTYRQTKDIHFVQKLSANEFEMLEKIQSIDHFIDALNNMPLCRDCELIDQLLAEKKILSQKSSTEVLYKVEKKGCSS